MPMMCSDARKTLSALLDRALDGPTRDAVRGHVDGCADCRGELETLARVDRAVRLAASGPVPGGYFDGLWTSIATRIAVAPSDTTAADPWSPIADDEDDLHVYGSRADELAEVRSLATATLQRHGRRTGELPSSAADVETPRFAAPASLRQIVVPTTDPRRRRIGWLFALAGATTVVAIGLWWRMWGPARTSSSSSSSSVTTMTTMTSERTVAAPPSRAPNAETAGAGTAPPSPPTVPLAAPTEPPEAPPVVAPVVQEKRPSVNSTPRPEPTRRPLVPAPPARASDTVKDTSADEFLRQLAEPTQPKSDEPPKTGRQKLSHDEISAGMDRVEPAVNACYAKLEVAGQVVVKVKILPSGAVAAVEAVDRFAGTPTGACVAAAVQRAVFVPFDGAAMTIRYSFTLQEE